MAIDHPLLVACPVCLRTIWNGSICNHGDVPVRPSVLSKKGKPKSRYGLHFLDNTERGLANKTPSMT